MDPRHIAYLQLVTSHQAALHGYIRSLAPGANVDDILQETNIVLWKHAENFKPGTRFKSYAFRIAHLKTLEALRRDRRKRWLVFDSDLLEAIAERTISRDPGTADAQAALRACLADMDEAEWMTWSATLRTRPIMPDFALRAMHDDDRRAIYRFIRSLGTGGTKAPEYLPRGSAPPAPFFQLVLPPAPPANPPAGG